MKEYACIRRETHRKCKYCGKTAESYSKSYKCWNCKRCDFYIPSNGTNNISSYLPVNVSTFHFMNMEGSIKVGSASSL